MPYLKPYKLFISLLMFLCFQEFRADGQDVAKAYDTARQSLLFKSHLLVHENEISPEWIDSLLENPVPLAVWSPGETSGFAKALAQRMPERLLPLILISEVDPKTSGQKVPELLALNEQELQKYEPNEEGTPSHAFLWIETLPDSMWQTGKFAELWKQTGRMPNFVSVAPGKLMQTAAIVRELNSQPKLFGIILDGDKLLSGVSWKDLSNCKTSGYFSFPVALLGRSALAPYKPGYRFSPDIILPSPENIPNLKIFNALPLDLDFELTDWFSFSNKVRNHYRQNDDEIKLYGLDFVKDQERGNCAFFGGRAFLDGGLRSRLALKPNFSITAWIKPAELGNNNCILGKGKDFVLKIHQGVLTFTVQGVKDYTSQKTQIPVNQWSFISLVHSVAGNHIRFYLNGELTEQIQLLKPYNASEYTMLIGSNLWEEFFKGYISEIKIWERELNDEEIRNEFGKKDEVGFTLSTGWLLSIFLFLGILGIGLRRWLLPRKTEKFSPVKIKTSVGETKEEKPAMPDQAQICCFGGLKVINSGGKDISLKFSPKIRQLFALILVHSEGDEKGISSKKLSDCLWPGMSMQKSKNIRGTTIQNMKTLLTSSCVRLVFQDKLWKFELTEGCFSDLGFVERQLNKLEKLISPEDLSHDLPGLLAVLKRGTLFQGLHESWLDPYVERMSNRIIEFGLRMFLDLQDEKYDSLLLEMAEVVSINDPLSEHSLRKKISILTRQGKLGLARSIFDNFARLYFELYQENYPDNYKTLMGGETGKADY